MRKKKFRDPFNLLVQLFRTKGESVIAAHLEMSVGLIRIEPGYIEVFMHSTAPVDLPNMVTKKLHQWTGESWLMAVSDKPPSIDAPPVDGDAFLKSFKWRELRMKVLKKYGRRCQCCGATPATGGIMNVDHIKPRKKYPELAMIESNLQVLCHECNHGKGNWDQTDWRAT